MTAAHQPLLIAFGAEPNWAHPHGFDVVSAEDFAAGVTLARRSSAPVAVLVRSEITPTRSLRAELEAAASDPALADVRWLLLASNGIDLHGREFDLGSYTDRAPTGARRTPRALAATNPAVAIMNTVALAALPEIRFNDPGELLTAGWEHGYGSFHVPFLRFSWNGAFAARPHRDQRRPAVPDRNWRTALAAVRPEPTVTFGIRTELNRESMLERTMESIATAAGADARVFLTGRVPPADLQELARRLGSKHPAIDLRTQALSPGSQPSRTAGLEAVVAGADSDYVWFVDDDDFLEHGALEHVMTAVHSSGRPIVLGRSVRIHEDWEDGRLIDSAPGDHFDPRLWFNALTGWNSLPVCSIVYPRLTTAERLAVSPLRHDLGEDYALFLLGLSAPGQDVVILNEILANVSIRPGSDNAVTQTDRSDWLLHASSFLSDLVRDPHAGEPLAWLLGEAISASVPRERFEELLAAAVAEATGRQPPWWKTAFWRTVPDRAHPFARRAIRRIRRAPTTTDK